MSKKVEEFLGLVNDYQLLKKASTLCSYYVYSLPFFCTNPTSDTMIYELIRAVQVNYIYKPYSVILLHLVSSLDAVIRYVYISTIN